MKKKIPEQNLRTPALIAGITVSGLLAGCSSGVNDTRAWEKSPGTQGYLNLDDVKKAFQKNGSIKEFEDRVNEIFEGDNLIVFRAEEETGGFMLSAYEDLNDSKEIDAKDELLFSIRAINKQAILQGAGINGYYKETWAYTPPEQPIEELAETPEVSETENESRHYRHHSYYPYFWYHNRGWGRYNTSHRRYDSMRNSRDQYRTTSGFTDQVNKNRANESAMSSKYGSNYRSNLTKTPSSNRQSYINTEKRSSGFSDKLASQKSTSAWGTRKSTGGSSAFTTASRPSTSSRSASSSRSYSSSRGSSGFGI